MQTTVGQLLVNHELPSEFRDYTRVLDQGGMRELASRVAAEKPEAYRDIMHRLYKVGARVSHTQGGSFKPSDLLPDPATNKRLKALRSRVAALINDDSLDDDQRVAAIQNTVLGEIEPVEASLYDEGIRGGNTLALQVHSGSRGKKSDMRAITAGEFMVADHKNRVIPIPILHGYSHGLTPTEQFASSFGTRKGQAATKLLVADSGFFSKKLQQAAHRQVVTTKDCGSTGGIPVDAQDADNLGAVLARDANGIPTGTVITAEVMRKLGDDKILVRSPLTCQAPQGICARCAGVRETGGFPDIGDNLGMVAAQSIGEPVSQGSLDSKHSGGRAGKDTRADRLTGLPLLSQFIDLPSEFRDAATLSTLDGNVDSVEDSPQGGKIITVDGEPHYVKPGFEASVRPGQQVRRGQRLSDGWINPAETLQSKGLGAARAQLVSTFRDALKANGVKTNRRNLEIVTRGLLNHVRVTDVDGTPGLPGDIMEYADVARDYKPRYGFRELPVRRSVGMYLETPALYHTIGTRVTEDIADELENFGVKTVVAHPDAPVFEPVAVRAMETSMRSPDWQVRLGGSYLQKGLLEAAHRGRSSDLSNTSFVPPLLKAVDFGTELRQKGKY